MWRCRWCVRGARYDGLTLPGAQPRFGPISDSTLLGVAPDRAAAQAQPEAPLDISGPQTRSATAGLSATTTPTADRADGLAPTKITGFHAAARLDPERYARDFDRIAQEVIARLGNATVELSVEITATDPAGFGPDVIRTVTENARTLKMDSFGFEEG